MNQQKNNRTKLQGAETKKKIYESAEKLFYQYDYNNVSIEAITEAAGVTKGTFYVHFDSKDALYIELFSTHVERLDLEYKDFLNNLPSDLSAADALLTFVGEVAYLMVEKVGYDTMRIIYQLQLTRAVSTDAINGYGRKIYEIFSDILNRGILQGEFRTSLTLEELTKHFVMAIRGTIYEWCIRYPDFDLQKEALAHCKLFLNGIQNAG